MTKPLQLALVLVVGLAAAHTYYRWLLSAGARALHSHGIAGYWLLNALPALVLFIALLVVSSRPPAYGKVWIIAGSIVAAIGISYVGLFGDFLLCVFVTRGVCE
jgi:hypothetical protein